MPSTVCAISTCCCSLVRASAGPRWAADSEGPRRPSHRDSVTHMLPSSNSWKSQKSHHWILEGARRRSWAHNPCKLSSQNGSQRTGYAGRASTCSVLTGACRCSRPVLYTSVGVEPVQRHGLALDPHCISSRTAHRARIGLRGQSGSETGGRWQEWMYW